MPIINVTLPSDGTTADVGDYNSVITTMLATINGLLDDDNIASVSGTKIVAGTIPASAFNAAAKQGYVSDVQPLPTTITYLGDRNYSLVYNGVDLTGYKSAGMRNRLTRSVAAPTQVTVLGGTKYWIKTSPNKMTFTDDWAVDLYIKTPAKNNTLQVLASRYNGTSGWRLLLDANFRVIMVGHNAGAGNFSQVMTNMTLQPGREYRISVQHDLSSFTNTSTTSYIMINGLDVPCLVVRGGTNPTAIVQAGNLEIGAESGGTSPFQGEISQLAIFNAKVTQATMLTYHGQAYAGNETSVLSAYSFNGVATDLNTTTPNDLTATNSAGYGTGGTFGINGLSSTLEYAVTESISFSVNTTEIVRVPAGCALPTSGGVAAMVFSTAERPYGFPTDKFNSGAILQTQRSEVNQFAVGSTTIPFDDTIPQQSEGDEYLSVTIKPRNANSILHIQCLAFSSHTAPNGQNTVALFRDSGADALQASEHYENTGTAVIQLNLDAEVPAGSTAATTFKIRMGSQNAGTTTLNGQSGARRYGGTAASFLKVTERNP
jgi:hypothetical protein